jgi:hypothetical protein
LLKQKEESPLRETSLERFVASGGRSRLNELFAQSDVHYFIDLSCDDGIQKMDDALRIIKANSDAYYVFMLLELRETYE